MSSKVHNSLLIPHTQGINEEELKELPKQKATIFESPMLRRVRRKLLPILSTFASAGHRDELVR